MRRLTPLAAAAALSLSLLAPAPPSVAGAVRSNPAAITINDNAAATPYSSDIAVSGIPRVITDVDVTLHGISHTWIDDLDILLVGPTGRTVMLLSDAGGASDFNASTVVFDDEPSRAVPDNGLPAALRFQPTSYEPTSDAMPAPAPAPPAGGTYGKILSVFDGTSANGTWKLFVRDDSNIDSGQIAGGWSLEITASPVNDDFARATPIAAAAATVTGDTVAASVESGEPGSGDSVWYRWVAPGAGQVALDLCASPSAMQVGVYTGSSVDSLTMVPISGTTCGGSYDITFTAVTGTLYWLRVAGSPAGSYVMQLTGPANTPPVVTPVSPRTSTKDRTPKVAAKVTDTAGLTAGSITVWVDGKRRGVFAYNAATGALSFTSRKLSYAKHTVKIRAVDFHGAATTRSWSFRVRR